MLFEVLSCISHVKVYIVAEVYCLYCRPCPAQTDPCQMDRDTQIIRRSLCFIFHLFFFIIFCMCLSIFICQIFVFCFVPARWTNTQNICTLYKDLFVFLQGAFPAIFSTITKNELPSTRGSLNVNKFLVG